MATQKLIVQPPYAHCRNPMALGAIVLYLGVAVTAGLPAAGLLWLPGSVALLAYIRLVEEQEMVARFGEEYLAYRRRVPFIIPWPHRREVSSQ
jgi:protein-S-isoprenylcysteine O-methyltransferase Ste14